jgi:hypothetical protein
MRVPGIKLTDTGARCCNPACAAALYVELMASPDAEACFDCDPEQFREEWSPTMRDLFERSGRRLPHGGPRCAEACCRKKAA